MNKLISALLVLFLTSISAAKDEEKQKAQAENEAFKRANASYQRCRKDALEQIKTGKISADGFKAKVQSCTERFPTASIYIDCKKKALESSSKANIKAELRKCKKDLSHVTFEIAEPFPFFSHAGKLYFGGIGINESLPIQNFKLPNFNCGNLNQSLSDPKSAEYFLFGNAPRVFAEFQKEKPQNIQKALKITEKKTQKDGLLIDGFGKLFGNLTKGDASVFFPTGYCVYDGDLGEHFSGLSAYYLLDSREKIATPYFGITFFKNKTFKMNDAIREATNLLRRSTSSSVVQSSHDGKIIFLSKSEIFSFDTEGDPKDLCKMPRNHKYVAALKKSADSKDFPEYLLIANIENLCEFGDQISSRFKL